AGDDDCNEACMDPPYVRGHVISPWQWTAKNGRTDLVTATLLVADTFSCSILPRSNCGADPNRVCVAPAHVTDSL
ncbi:MAG: hypothetical protein ACREB3_14805, partial [Burkholderiales bacterium]